MWPLHHHHRLPTITSAALATSPISSRKLPPPPLIRRRGSSKEAEAMAMAEERARIINNKLPLPLPPPPQSLHCHCHWQEEPRHPRNQRMVLPLRLLLRLFQLCAIHSATNRRCVPTLIRAQPLNATQSARDFPSLAIARNCVSRLRSTVVGMLAYLMNSANVMSQVIMLIVAGLPSVVWLHLKEG